MSWDLSDKEFKKLMKLDDDGRFDMSIKTFAEKGEAWVIAGEDGYVMVGTGEEEMLPLWPHPKFAEPFLTGDWAGCKAEAIPVDLLMENIVPELGEEEKFIAVFPKMDGDELVGVVVDAQDFLDVMAGELGDGDDEDDDEDDDDEDEE